MKLTPVRTRRGPAIIKALAEKSAFDSTGRLRYSTLRAATEAVFGSVDVSVMHRVSQALIISGQIRRVGRDYYLLPTDNPRATENGRQLTILAAEIHDTALEWADNKSGAARLLRSVRSGEHVRPDDPGLSAIRSIINQDVNRKRAPKAITMALLALEAHT